MGGLLTRCQRFLLLAQRLDQFVVQMRRRCRADITVNDPAVGILLVPSLHKLVRQLAGNRIAAGAGIKNKKGRHR